MKTRILLTLLVTLLLTSCSKDNNGLISISGITARDDQGNLLGGLDETDWTSDNTFSETISPLLNFTDDANYSNAEVSTVQIIAYPNPFETRFNLHVNVSKETVVKLVIVDESLKVYTEYAMNLQTGGNVIAFQTNSNFQSNKYYRVYYAFYDKTKTIYFKGHGDIKKK